MNHFFVVTIDALDTLLVSFLEFGLHMQLPAVRISTHPTSLPSWQSTPWTVKQPHASCCLRLASRGFFWCSFLAAQGAALVNTSRTTSTRHVPLQRAALHARSLPPQPAPTQGWRTRRHPSTTRHKYSHTPLSIMRSSREWMHTVYCPDRCLQAKHRPYSPLAAGATACTHAELRSADKRATLTPAARPVEDEAGGGRVRDACEQGIVAGVPEP